MDNVFTIRTALFIGILLLCFTPWISPALALIIGFIFSITLGFPLEYHRGKITNLLLKLSVVGLGFGLHASEAIKVGKEAFLITILSIVTTLSLGWITARFLNLNKKIAHLISAGTAICGGSAIATIAPAIKANSKDISISLSIIFLLNSIALFIFPIIGNYLNLSQHDFGLWSSIAIHDTSSVVGAASHYGEEALKIATTVKLSRALWVVPAAIISVILFKTEQSKIRIPWFILGFISVIILNTYVPFFSKFEINKSLFFIAQKLLVVSLFFIGGGLSFKAIKEEGWKPLLLGSFLWIFISIASLCFILSF